MKRSEKLTNLAVEISGLKVRAEILELWDVIDSLERAYSGAIVFVRLAMEKELMEEQERLDRGGVGA